MSLEFSGPARRLALSEIAAAAQAAGVEYAMVRAVMTVETEGRGGFLPDTRPRILCEAAKFHFRTGGAYDRTHPHISSPTWNRALYASSGEGEYVRLGEMLSLNRQAALMSASWGMFQIMGENYAACGHASVEAFVAAMCTSELAHLQAFLAFIRSDGLIPLMRGHDFAGVARRYNGPLYAENRYDVRLREAYQTACREPPPPLPSATVVVEATPPTQTA